MSLRTITPPPRVTPNPLGRSRLGEPVDIRAVVDRYRLLDRMASKPVEPTKRARLFAVPRIAVRRRPSPASSRVAVASVVLMGLWAAGRSAVDIIAGGR